MGTTTTGGTINKFEINSEGINALKAKLQDILAICYGDLNTFINLIAQTNFFEGGSAVISAYPQAIQKLLDIGDLYARAIRYVQTVEEAVQKNESVMAESFRLSGTQSPLTTTKPCTVPTSPPTSPSMPATSPTAPTTQPTSPSVPSEKPTTSTIAPSTQTTTTTVPSN